MDAVSIIVFVGILAAYLFGAATLLGNLEARGASTLTLGAALTAVMMTLASIVAIFVWLHSSPPSFGTNGVVGYSDFRGF